MKLRSIRLHRVMAAAKLCAAIAAAKCFGKNKRIWMISERPTQARDNGYCFFCYMRKCHPEQECIYVINRKAEDYQKLAFHSKCIVQYGSLKHYFYYCLSKVHISSHVNGCCPESAVPASRRLKKRIGFKDVFLPHGVSYGISEFCLKKYTDIDLFITSGRPEYENVLANYGYAEREVAYTGFPRLDGWHGAVTDPRQIVLMPTWRLYLAQDPNTEIQETAYFKAYQELLDNRELKEFLTENGLRLIFYLHHEMRKYASFFQSSNACIEVVYRDDRYDIQELLKSSALLITDYSSVHFDFAYMNKPVIYYQFDREEFFDRQYRRTSFHAEEDGFGPVCVTGNEVVQRLKEFFADNWRVPAVYRQRMRTFYQLYDDQNCERVYQVIRESIDS